SAARVPGCVVTETFTRPARYRLIRYIFIPPPAPAGTSAAGAARPGPGRPTFDGRGPQRGCAARPACARTGMETPEPHAGAALAGPRLHCLPGGAALWDFAALRAEFARSANGATPAGSANSY